MEAAGESLLADRTGTARGVREFLIKGLPALQETPSSAANAPRAPLANVAFMEGRQRQFMALCSEQHWDD